MLSIGGWGGSTGGSFAHITDAGWVEKFAQSAVRMVEDYGLDGLDIDYEYPKTAAEADAYVNLLRYTRFRLRQLAISKLPAREQFMHKGPEVPNTKCDARLLLTVAAPCGRGNMEILKINQMDQFLNFWNLMAYDFAGSWESVAGHQANLHSNDPNTPSAAAAVEYYKAQGVPAHKLVLGMPLYGRAFANTNGIGEPYSGVGEGSWEPGLWDYKALPQVGAQEVTDVFLKASYSYDPSKRLLISYDTPAIAVEKANYIVGNGLKGAMFWELDADKSDKDGSDESIVATVSRTFGSLDSSLNELNYPGSKFDNLRKGMQ